MAEAEKLGLPIEIVTINSPISLRQLTLNDVDELFALIDRNRDWLSQFGDETASKYPTREKLKESIINPSNPDRLRFTIRNEDGIVVGSINLTTDPKNKKKAEIGYYLGEEFTGKGYATKAIELLTDFGFNQLNYELIYAKVTKGNNSSISALKRAGYLEAAEENDEVIYSKTNKTLVS